MRLVEVRVERSEHLAIPTSVPAWEIPVLGAIHGPEKIVEIRRYNDDRPYPTAAEEYDRMHRRFGVHVESDTSWVKRVYGEGPIAMRGLQQAIDQEMADGNKAAKEAADIDPTL